MPLRIPPGRAGRPWLAGRVELARRASQVLGDKRRALQSELALVREELEQAAAAWEAAATEAATWLGRAAILGGERQLRLAAGLLPAAADIALERRRSMGVAFPAVAHLDPSPLPDLAALGASAALVLAAEAHRRALAAAARHAVAGAACRLLEGELDATLRRLRAVEKRWLPMHEAALAELELALDDADREHGARLRWLLDHPSRERQPGEPRARDR
jgi:V/A-type H+-transporting ATPase subunit D